MNYLVTVKKYPASSIAVEKELDLNGIKKRYDVVVFTKQLSPFLIIECKAPYIQLDQSVIEQALRYNLVVKAELVMITNGVSDLVFNQKQEVIDLPSRFE